MESKVAILTGSGVDTDTENQEPDDGKHLDRREPKLKFPVKADGQEIDGSDNNPENSDKNADRQIFIPILDDETSCGEFQSVGDGPRKPVDPTH